jgi:hypothetical protein
LFDAADAPFAPASVLRLTVPPVTARVEPATCDWSPVTVRAAPPDLVSVCPPAIANALPAPTPLSVRLKSVMTLPVVRVA